MPECNKGKYLCQDSRDGGTLDTHVECKDEKWVENGIDDHRRDGCRHCHMGVSSASQGTVQTQVEVSDDIAQEDDEHIIVGILEGILRGTEEEQQGIDEDESQDTHKDTDDDIE